MRQLVQQRCQVIFQVGFPLDRQKGNDLLVVDAAGAFDAEIERVAAAGRRRPDAGGIGFVLFRRERFRIDIFQNDLAVA